MEDKGGNADSKVTSGGRTQERRTEASGFQEFACKAGHVVACRVGLCGQVDFLIESAIRMFTTGQAAADGENGRRVSAESRGGQWQVEKTACYKAP